MSTAVARAKNFIYDRHRRLAAKNCTELFDVRTQINVSGATYVHAPYWLVNYEFKRKKYSVAVNGTNGKVLIGKIPMTFSRRVVNFLLAVVGLLVGIYAYRISSFVNVALISTDEDLAGVLGLMVLSVLLIFSFVIIAKAIKTVFATELEKKGE